MNELSHTITTIKGLIALLIFTVTVLAGFYPFKKQLKTGIGFEFPIGESLACGVFLGAGLMHMLAESATRFGELGIHYPLASFLTGATFLLFLWLEHIGREVYGPVATCEHQVAPLKRAPIFSLLAVFMLSIHALLEGAALGLTDEYSVVAVLFIAIIGHKWMASFSVAVLLNKSVFSRRMALLFFALFSLMTPIGLLVGSHINASMQHSTLLAPIFSSLAAGTFLYLGTLHGLEKGVLIKQCCNLHHFSFVIIGFIVMALIAVYT